MSKRSTVRWLPLVLGGLVIFSGCGRDRYPASLRYPFHVHPTFNTTTNEQEFLGQDLTAEEKTQIEDQLEPYFGTPGDPMVKISPELAANPEFQFSDETLQEGSKLYRRFCLHCHGLVGDGKGPTGAFLNPKPRDFRSGKFKFRSTVKIDPTTKHPNTGTIVAPSRADLIKTVKMGIPTAAMPSFTLLDEEKELNPLVSYVIHLSLRGQAERRFFPSPPDDLEAEIGQIAASWLYGGRKGSSEKVAYPVPKPPAEFASADTSEAMKRYERGKTLYLSKGGCVECHGKDGRANLMEIPTNKGRRNEWGDLNPPRNLTFGYFRGGSRPLDLYYRMRLGIAGSGMPAAADAVSDEEVWYLVDYVLALPSQQR